MVDAERLHRLLRRVSDDLTVLGRYAGADRADLLGDDVRLGHVKYTFVTALEACIDAAQHVCASEGLGPPETNADAFRVLARHGLIDAGLGDRLAAAVGFRNVLVHGYAEVDDGLVVANLDRLADLHGLVDALARLVTEEGEKPG